MKLEHRVGNIVGSLVLVLFLAFETGATETNQPPECSVKLTVIGGSKEPVIKQGDPGTEGNKYGFEGGCVFKHKGIYHMFASEEIGDPYWVKMRFGHWTSPDRVKWTRQDTISETSGVQNGIDLKAATWAPMPFYDEKAKVWNMYYVAYRSKPCPPDASNGSSDWYVNYDGRIVRAISQTPGPDGLNGPWKDVGIVLEPDWEPWKKNGSQPWEGLQGTDSISPPFQARNGKWMAFYGSCQSQGGKINAAYKKCNPGLAEAPAPTGPWTRCAQGNPMPFHMGQYCENPIATRVADDLYIMVCDRTQVGYATSTDGVHWSRAENIEFPKELKTWEGRTTTPMGYIPEEDGTGTIFFMTHVPNAVKGEPEWETMRFVRVKVERNDTK